MLTREDKQWVAMLVWMLARVILAASGRYKNDGWDIIPEIIKHGDK